jgi:hypothetical protein
VIIFDLSGGGLEAVPPCWDLLSEVKVGRARWNELDRESAAGAGATLTGRYNEKRAAADRFLPMGFSDEKTCNPTCNPVFKFGIL